MIVTVSNEYGSGALAIARRVADTLHYEYVDEQLPVVVAKRLQVTPEEVVANEEASPSLGERLLNSLELATPELATSSVAEPFDEALQRAVRDAVREYAARGNVVIVGRGASAILTGRAGILRVFLHAPRQWRVTHVVESARVPLEVARAEVDRIDRARAALYAAMVRRDVRRSGKLRSLHRCVASRRATVRRAHRRRRAGERGESLMMPFPT